MRHIWTVLILGFVTWPSFATSKSLRKDLPEWVKSLVESHSANNNHQRNHSSNATHQRLEHFVDKDTFALSQIEDANIQQHFVYYRVSLHLISVQYDNDLASPHSELFKSIGDELSASLVRAYRRIPGEHFVTVLKLEKPGRRENGTVAKLDIGIDNYDNVKQIEDILRKAVKNGRLDKFKIGSKHFRFTRISKPTDEHNEPGEAENEEELTTVPAADDKNSETDKESPICASYEFECLDGSCIDARRICDGTDHCQDGSDESADHGRCNLDPSIFMTNTNISVMEGKPLAISGAVHNLGSGTLLWTKSPHKILTIGQAVVAFDPRISVELNETSNEYSMKINNTKRKDSGNYTLVVDLRNKKFSKTVQVTVMQKQGNSSKPKSKLASLKKPLEFAHGYLAVREHSRAHHSVHHASQREHNPPQQGRCPHGYYECRSGHCLEISRWCDSHVDCPDHDDEATCTRNEEHRPDERHLQQTNDNNDIRYRELDLQSTHVICGLDEFKCLYTENCVPEYARCNGVYDCSDCSDESGCPNEPQCRLNDFKCLTSGECISLDRRCNGHRDCNDGSDEDQCHQEHEDGRNHHNNRDECNSNQFKCRDGNCIDLHLKCDSYPDCRDGSDEENCQRQRRTCDERREFACVSGECIDIRRKCDARADCDDSSDEHHCPSAPAQPECPPNHFQCGTGHCLELIRRCDKYPDCPDHSDEQQCSYNNQHETAACHEHEFRCRDGSCIDVRRKCDTKSDCPDASDEDDCRQYVSSSIGESGVSCSPDEFKCPNEQCVHIDSRCNGRNECPDGFDELNCEEQDLNGNGDEEHEESCNANEFECVDTGDCIDKKLRCDGVSHCQDGSDERQCSICSNEQFRCNDGRCIPIEHRCDGTVECHDSSDEHLCHPTGVHHRPDHEVGRCTHEQFRCNSGQCISKQQKCDRQYDCEDLSDENDCGSDNDVVLPPACGEGEFQCHSDNRCIESRRKCDDFPDCPDSSDERSCPSKENNAQSCRSDEFSCKDGTQCIESSRKCDGHYDCYDYSDERDCACGHDEFRCHSDSYCIDIRRKCDGYADCVDRSDENDCEVSKECSNDEFRCKDGSTCIEKARKCDRQYDCNDYSDEDDCHAQPPPLPQPPECQIDEFKCASGECIDARRKCDRQYDCNDYSDETNCNDKISENDIDTETHHLQCNADEFRCADSERCIDARRRCDRHFDCSDYSDERNCETENRVDDVRCESNEFLCSADNRCIDDRQKCDNNFDCSDGSDEANCPVRRECAHHEFKCSNGDCIDERRKCDGRPDCSDSSDEDRQACENSIDKIDCTEFLCGTGECIHSSVRCDSKSDCRDSSDEDNCPAVNRVCGSDEFRCNDDGRCIDIQRKCDRRPDCRDGSDERNCHAENDYYELHVEVHPSGPIYVTEGTEARFQCRTNDPYTTVKWTRIDGSLPYGSTEHNGYLLIPNVQTYHSGTYACSATNDLSSKDVYVQLIVESHDDRTSESRSGFGARCGPDEGTCQNGECIRRSSLCDGEYDCRDRSDELNCGGGGGKECEPNEFRCNNNKCVQKMWVCDSEDDCGDRSDEASCGEKRPGDVCAPYQYKCQTRDQCVARSYQCDGQNDCLDGSDEVGCLAPTVVEPPVRELSVCRGATIVITCRAVGGPVPHINWRLNWGPVCPPPRCTQISENGRGTLNIRDANDRDQGAYTCEAVNVKGRVLGVPDAIVTVRPSCAPEPSLCNAAGTVTPERTPCRCKTYATGPTCGDCVENAYYLAPRNPQGCIRCFCMGITKQCQSSNYFRTKETMVFTYDDQGIMTTDIQDSRPEAPRSDFNRNRGYITVDSRGGGTQYWKLPQRMAGNKLTAYGGKLKFNVQYSGYGQPVSDPLIVLKGNEITLVYRGNDQQLQPDRPNTVEVDMFENAWTREDGREATREHLMMTLADIETFLIRQTHCQDQTSSSLGEIILDVAVSTDTQQEKAFAVEECRCPQGYQGLSCEECAPGYVRTGGGLYLGTCEIEPTDQKRVCDPAGSVSTARDANGRCRCKEYATGDNCDQCKPHSFHLDSKNADGCLSCFCSGVTRDCGSSNYYRTQERLAIGSGAENDIVIRTNEPQGFFTSRARASVGGRRDLTINDFSDQPFGRALYMELPRQFIGNKITSYGGNLKFSFRFSGSGRTDTGPTVVIRGNDITLYYRPKQDVRSDSDQTLEVPFYEHHWTREDGLQSTREHMLMTLAGLNSILVKVTHTDGRTNSFSLSDLSMDYAIDRPTGGERAFAVEQCRCPPGYKGTSCEECDQGYSRTGGGLYLGLCERCFCNGHSDKCDSEFGDCIDCQHNTEGPQCNRCKPGFEGNALGGTPDDCRPAQGCRTCECYNHSPRGCDQDCRCLVCEHNTEGLDCGKCKKGFYGDARGGTPYDCTPCPCPGAKDCYLDPNGRVVCIGCPPGYLEPDCKRCAPGYAPDPYEPGTCRPIGPPRVRIIDPKYVDTEQGTTTTFRCESVDGGNVRLNWRRPGYPSLPQGSYASPDGTLTLYNVSPNDSGQYECEGTTDDGQRATDEGTLNVRPRGGPLDVRIREPKIQEVEEGATVIFTCEVVGPFTKPYNLAWTREGYDSLPAGTRDRDGTLTLYNVKSSDSGRYVCTGSTPEETDRDEAEIRIKQKGQGPRPIVTPKVLTVEAGQPAEFTCTSGGSPPPVIMWGYGQPANPLRAGIQQNDGRLYLPNASPSDAGTYYCTAANIHDTVSEPAQLIVTSPRELPTVRIDPPSGDVPLGADFEFRCTATGYPQPDLAWTREDNRPIEANVHDDGRGILSFSRCTKNNAGTYVCTATNTVGPVSATAPLKVGDDLEVIIVPTMPNGIIDIRDGDPLKLECIATVSPGLPEPIVEWIYDRGPERGDVPEGFKPVETHGRSVTHRAVSENNEGKYTCRATSGDLMKEVSVQLNVTPRGKRDVVIIGASERPVPIGGTLDLQCILNDPKPDQTLKWIRINGDLPREADTSNVGSLVISGFRQEHAGVYECQQVDRSSDDILSSSHVKVLVEGPSRHEHSQTVEVDGPGVRVVQIGETLSLTCSSPAGGSGRDELRWVNRPQEGQERPTRGKVSNGVLTITNLKPEDSGYYACIRYEDGARDGEYQVTVIVSSSEADAVRTRAAAGAELELHCPMYSITGMKYTWTRLRGSLPPGAYTEGAYLKIPNFQPDYAGVYKCETTVESVPATGFVKLALEETNVIQVMLDVSPDYVHLGNDVTFRCVVEGDERATIRWERGEGRLPTNAYVAGNSLTIRNVVKEDTGIYRCLASTKVGVLSTDAVLQVGRVQMVYGSSSPSVTIAERATKSAVGLEEKIYCPARTVKGTDAKIEWTKVASVLPENSTVDENGVLHLPRLSAKDAGTYTCTVTTKDNYRVKLNVSLVVHDLIPTFDGEGYIELPPLPAKSYKVLDINMSFRTTSPDGLLFYSGAEDGEEEGDFLAIGLVDGKPVLKFDVGGGVAEAVIPHAVSSNEWHTITIKREDNRGIISLAGERAHEAVAPGTQVGLGLGKSSFVGGHPSFANLSAKVGFAEGLKGSVSEVLINGQDVKLGEYKLSSTKITQTPVCQMNPCLNDGICEPAAKPKGYKCRCIVGFSGTHCEKPGHQCGDIICDKRAMCVAQNENGAFKCLCPIHTNGPTCSDSTPVTGNPYFDGDYSFMTYSKPERTTWKLNLTMKIRPASLNDGLLFYMGSDYLGMGDYIGLILRDGSIELDYDCGTGHAQLRNDLEIKAKQWYEIKVDRSNQHSKLTVNGHTVASSAPGKSTDLDLNTPLFIGGYYPHMVVPSVLGVKISFHGCIANVLTVNDKQYRLLEDHLESANIRSCDTLEDPCETNPCQAAQATCLVLEHDNFKCVCPTGFSGERCEKQDDELCKPGICGEHGKCVTVDGIVECKCDIGFEGPSCDLFVSVESQAFFDGTAYLELGKSLLPHISSDDREIIELKIRTSSNDGLILWHGQEPTTPGSDQDYLSLGITDGFLEFSYELGGGPAHIVSRIKVNDGKTHSVRLIRQGQSGQMLLDDLEAEAGKSGGILAMLNTDGNIYIGGVPDLPVMTSGRYTKNFDGCILDVKFNEKVVDFMLDHEGGFNVKQCESERFSWK